MTKRSEFSSADRMIDGNTSGGCSPPARPSISAKKIKSEKRAQLGRSVAEVGGQFVDGGQRLGDGLGHHHALAGRQTVGLDHDRRAAFTRGRPWPPGGIA